MKNIILAIALFCSSFLIGQNGILVPPDKVIAAFAKQYPNKKTVWDLEYNGKNDDVIFEAKFSETLKTIAFARFDQNGNFKSYKCQIQMTKLPLKAQTYLKKNYGVKSFRQSFTVLDNENIKTYESAVVKDQKNYNLVFDKEGEFIKRIQIR